MSNLSAGHQNVFEKLARATGANYDQALKDSAGWTRMAGLLPPPGSEREGEITLTKPVPGTNDELRIARWDSRQVNGDPFRYALEVGRIDNPYALSFGVGMTGSGEPGLTGVFEAAFARLNT